MGRVSMPQGKGSQIHNRREYERIGKPMPDHVDVSRSHENVILVDRELRQAYEEIFGEALERYNSKQKRADRKIDSYYEHIKKSKNGEKLFYEDVVQWGAKEDFQNSPETRQRAKEALMGYVSTFEERNPNLKLVGAYIHMDEASPHLHLDYVPVARGYSRGLEMRNSLDKAMKQMGFQPEKESRKNNATKLWKESERAYFGELCRNMGLEVEAERKARGSLSVEEYKEAREQMIGSIEQERADLTASVSDLKGKEEQARSDAEKAIREAQEARERAETELMRIEPPSAIKAVQAKPTISKRYVKVPVEDWETMKSTAELATLAVDQRDRARQEIERLQESNNRQFRALKHTQEVLTHSVADLKRENDILKRENKSLKEQISRMLEKVLEKVRESVRPLWEKFVRSARSKNRNVITFEDSENFWARHDRGMYEELKRSQPIIDEASELLGGRKYLTAEMLRMDRYSEQSIHRFIQGKYPEKQQGYSRSAEYEIEM